MSLHNLIVMGISTGGPKTLKRVFGGLPRLDAAIVLVQHMPSFINQSICRTLAGLTSMDVTLAADGQRLESGGVYLAPSEVHLELVNNSRVRLFRGPKVCFVCPAADVLMKSVRRTSRRLIGVIMTGMGHDGSEGIRHVKGVGGLTLAQDEASSAIWGMPGSAVETGCVDEILSPEGIRDRLIREVGVLQAA